MKEKRMISDYEVIASQRIGKDEIIIGENTKAQPSERFLCCYVDANELFESYRDAVVCDNFAEITKEYGERIVKSAATVLKEQENEQNNVGVIGELSNDDVMPISMEDNLEGKVVVIRINVLRPEYRRATHQLMLCTGGFGSQPNARGRTCYCISLYNGKQTSLYRSDFIGTMEPDKLPEWAKNGLEKAKEIRREESTPPKKKERGEAR